MGGRGGEGGACIIQHKYYGYVRMGMKDGTNTVSPPTSICVIYMCHLYVSSICGCMYILTVVIVVKAQYIAAT